MAQSWEDPGVWKANQSPEQAGHCQDTIGYQWDTSGTPVGHHRTPPEQPLPWCHDQSAQVPGAVPGAGAAAALYLGLILETIILFRLQMFFQKCLHIPIKTSRGDLLIVMKFSIK